MVLNPTEQDKRGLVAPNFDLSYDSRFPNGDKPDADPSGLIVLPITQGTPNTGTGTISDPFIGVQYAQSQSPAGSLFYFREGAVYDESWDAGGVNAMHITANGNRFESFPGERAIVDQTTSGANGFWAINIASPQIQNLDIRNCSGNGGVVFETGVTDPVCRNLNITNIDNPTAGSNCGGIYIGLAASSLVQRALVENCSISNVSIAGNQSAGNASCIHSYASEEGIIRQCTFTAAGNGVFWKRATGTTANLVERCLINDLTHGVRMSVAGAGDPIHINQRINQCIMYNILQNSVYCELNPTDIALCNQLTVSNCVFDGFTRALFLRRFTNIDYFNNIFINNIQQSIAHHFDVVSPWGGTHNCYFNSTSYVYDRLGPGQTFYTTLPSWQASPDAPDANSNTFDPEFINQAARDYRLAAASLLLGTGRANQNYGAYIETDQSDQIGANIT